MESKREVTSVDIAALVEELADFTGATLDKAYRYSEDLIRLKLRHYDVGRIELLIEVGEVKRLHTADPARVPEAPDRPPNFAKMLRNRIAGGTLVSVSQYEFDRIVILEFERGNETTTIVVELFGDGNLAVLDPLDEVIDSIRTVRLRSRTVAPGATYEFPQTRINPLKIDRETFEAVMRESDADIVRTVATQLNLGGRYAEEVCTRASVDKTTPIEDATREDFDRVFVAISDLSRRIREQQFEPQLYLDDDVVVDVTPFPLEEHEMLESKPFESFNEAVAEYFYRLDQEDEPTASPTADLTAEIERQQRIIDQQENAIEEFHQEAIATRTRAEKLYAEYDTADEIIRTVRDALEDGHGWEEIETTLLDAAEDGIHPATAVRSVDAESGTVVLDLDGTQVTVDPTVGVEKNADRIYTEAKEIEQKAEGARSALAETEDELETLLEKRSALDETQDTTAGGHDGDSAASPSDWRSRSSIPIRRSDDWYERFRWFRTSDEFLVIGGRNADQNEKLVRKYLEPMDLFFHAQARGGPVTILKATDPSERADSVTIPDRSRREAATFAVSYSSVWKDGKFSGDAYEVGADQVSKTPESGEYLEKGSFAIRGDREYYRDIAVDIAIGITCEPMTRVIGGPRAPIEPRAECSYRIEPGRFAQGDVAKRLYRKFRNDFADTSFVRKVASPDRIQHFLPPGGSRIRDE